MSSKDPKGYYACLGVQPSATAQEIKAAYRRLAKIHHPDSNSRAEAETRFQAIQSAYHVLSDPGRRGEYDSAAYSAVASDRGQDTRLQPIHCSKCAKVTAQPRYVVFYHVVSVIMVTLSTPIQGIYCSRCARKAAFRASAISAFAGWWGFPWGPILTVTNIFRNALGGTRQREAEERLIWYNALAFLSSGNLPLALALARRLRTATNEIIAVDAVRLIDHLRARGVPASAAALSDPWRPKVPQIFGHALLACAVPLFFIGLYMQEQISGAAARSISPSQSLREASDRPKSVTQTPTVSSSWTSPQEIEINWDELIPKCGALPVNGEVLDGYAARTQAEGHALEIRNGSGSHAIIKVRDTNSARLAVSLFVKKGETAVFTKLPDGVYNFQYAFGTELAQDCRSFARITSAQRMPDSETLTTTYTSTQIVRSSLMYTLYSVPHGNVRPQHLDPANF